MLAVILTDWNLFRFADSGWKSIERFAMEFGMPNLECRDLLESSGELLCIVKPGGHRQLTTPYNSTQLFLVFSCSVPARLGKG